MTRAFEYSLWLLPEANAQQYLQTRINALAEQQHIAPFSPHVTLCAGTWQGDLTTLTQVVSQLAQALSVTTFSTLGIDYIDAKYQCFYIALNAADFSGLAQTALARFPEAHLPSVGPHISLMYADDYHTIDRASLKQQQSALVPDIVTVDRLGLALNHGPDSADPDCASVDWHIVYDCALMT